MDSNLPQWLRKHLGLPHMSEADLNFLVFHPRHGGLCRRFVKFLADSTLCQQRFPNVYAKEELEQSQCELETKTAELRTLFGELGQLFTENEDRQREIDFISDKLDYFKSIEKLYRKTIERLEMIIDRPNYRLDQVRESVQPGSLKYLANKDLTELYSNDLREISLKDLVKESLASSQGGPTTLLRRQQSHHIETEYNELVSKIDSMHKDLSKVLENIFTQMSRLDYDQMEVKKTPSVEAELLAFKMPDCQEVIVEANKEEKELWTRKEQLSQKVIELEQQVMELALDYKSRRDEMNRKCIDELKSIKSLTLPADSFCSERSE